MVAEKELASPSREKYKDRKSDYTFSKQFDMKLKQKYKEKLIKIKKQKKDIINSLEEKTYLNFKKHHENVNHVLTKNYNNKLQLENNNMYSRVFGIYNRSNLFLSTTNRQSFNKSRSNSYRKIDKNVPFGNDEFTTFLITKQNDLIMKKINEASSNLGLKSMKKHNEINDKMKKQLSKFKSISETNYQSNNKSILFTNNTIPEVESKLECITEKSSVKGNNSIKKIKLPSISLKSKLVIDGINLVTEPPVLDYNENNSITENIILKPQHSIVIKDEGDPELSSYINTQINNSSKLEGNRKNEVKPYILIVNNNFWQIRQKSKHHVEKQKEFSNMFNKINK